MERFAGQVAVVTGAGSGIGRELARGCAAEGAQVHLVDVNESVREVADELGGVAHVCDVSDPGAVRAVFGGLESVDAAFLNAGVNGVPSMLQDGGALDELPFEAWRRVLTVNLDGLFCCLQESARIMKRQQRGSIVVTASTAGLRPEPRVSYPYVASKHAVVGLVKQASLELAGYGVRVNAIAPGPVVTNIGGTAPRPEAAVAAWENSIPARRWGQPSEVTDLALLLADARSAWMTGGVHLVDGGASALTQVLSSELPGARR
ncbi:SDR family NAD(P)-dependent oxidoreductase [Amycolatopsis alkalitolerans]|uniref:SDR family oxidoreductase n=1 Tax=Amycolatopsis alkalitolerans TaxID=2547244 RepID=A0A5C4LZ45_9PSEU|nr:SDR family NAD(P)-dependent oxidoreductase [Amycolatopsis alkalitolerans]TNC25074.1 SDR family oxidoreductase [Amycolatopsis alkalitolerans]